MHGELIGIGRDLIRRFPHRRPMTNSRELVRRLADHAREWRVFVDRMVESSGSYVVFGSRNADPVVLKVSSVSDEARAGEVLRALAGSGVVAVREHARGAVLIDRLMPGYSLDDPRFSGTDD